MGILALFFVAIWVGAGPNTLDIAISADSSAILVHKHKRAFVLAGFEFKLACSGFFNRHQHHSLLAILITFHAGVGFTQFKRKPTEVGFLSFCYEVCLTLGCRYQAANANCSSFAFTFFASSAGNPQP